MLEKIMSYAVVGSLVWIVAVIVAGLLATIGTPLFDICRDVLIPATLAALFITIAIIVVDHIRPE